jgi:uncharacterized repeat protein (TIGR01451 family)
VLELKITQRTAAVVGSNVTFGVEITNRGATVAKNVTVTDTFDVGLEPLSSRVGVDPHSSVPTGFTVGDINPGITVQRSVTFRVTKAGQLCHRMEAAAADRRHAEASSCVTAVAPAITNPTPPAATYPGTNTAPPALPTISPPEIRVTSQAAIATVGQSILFTVTIRNVSQQPLANIRVAQQSEAALEVTNMTRDGVRDGNALVWNLPSLPAGESRAYQVECKCLQVTPKACCRFTVSSAGGRAVDGQACIEITPGKTLPTNPLPVNPIPGSTGAAPPPTAPSRLTITVNNRNTVAVGNNQQFVVSVSNDGEVAENDIVVTAQLPRDSTLVRAESDPSATFQQQTDAVSFGRIADLPPHATKSFRITVTTSKPGPISMQAEATSRRQPQPVRGSATVEVQP